MQSRGDVIHGKQHAGLVVGPHERDEGGLIVEGGAQGVEVESAMFIDGNLDDFRDPLAGKLSAQFARCGMFDGARDDLFPWGARREQPANGGVDCLGAAAGEHQFCFAAMDERRDLRSCFINRLARPLAKTMDAGGISVPLGQIRQHRLHHFCGRSRGGVVVKVNEVHCSYRIVASGHLSVVSGQWSVVSGQWSVVSWMIHGRFQIPGAIPRKRAGVPRVCTTTDHGQLTTDH